jgi:Tfp pilus assembly protein PilZ
LIHPETNELGFGFTGRTAGVFSVSVNLEPTQFLSGWRPETGSIFLPAVSEARVGDQVAARIGIFGQTIRATVFGKVSLVRRVGRPALPPGVELSLDRTSIPAAGFLAMAARGEPVTFRERSPRFNSERRLSASQGQGGVEVTTTNVSEGGCALRWSGPLPLVGDLVQIKLGGSFFSPSARAVVCWNQPGADAERTVGLRVIAEGRAGKAWRALVGEIARSGARAA